jgi:chromosome segregation ATPase
MKATIKQALAGVGLTPAGQLQKAAEESRQMSEKVKSLEDRIAKLRADAETWKHRYEEIAAKLREWKDLAAQAEADAERMRSGAEHAKARASEWKARADALEQEKRDLRARLDEVQRTASTTREYLLATEAKLDLVEAALQVLDSRTREAAITRS